MGLFSSIFGGGVSEASQKTQDAQQADLATRRSGISGMSGQSRERAEELFGQGIDARRQANQNAMQMIAGAVAPTYQAAQLGNVAAQNQISATLPEYANAIYGLPMNYGSFKPVQLEPDFSYLQPFMPSGAGAVTDMEAIAAVDDPAMSRDPYRNQAAQRENVYVVDDGYETPIIQLGPRGLNEKPRPTRATLISAGLGDRFPTDMLGRDFNMARYQYEGEPVRGGGAVFGGQLTDGQLEQLARGIIPRGL